MYPLKTDVIINAVIAIICVLALLAAYYPKRFSPPVRFTFVALCGVSLLWTGANTAYTGTLGFRELKVEPLVFAGFWVGAAVITFIYAWFTLRLEE